VIGTVAGEVGNRHWANDVEVIAKTAPTATSLQNTLISGELPGKVLALGKTVRADKRYVRQVHSDP
jgi:hypothetical protein